MVNINWSVFLNSEHNTFCIYNAVHDKLRSIIVMNLLKNQEYFYRLLHSKYTNYTMGWMSEEMFDSCKSNTFLSSPKSSDWLRDLPSYSVFTGALFPLDLHLRPKIKIEWIYTCTPSCTLMACKRTILLHFC